MARNSKNPFMLVMILLVVIAILSYSAYTAYEGYRSVDCQGMICLEGEFCQKNTCHPISPPSTNI